MTLNWRDGDGKETGFLRTHRANGAGVPFVNMTAVLSSSVAHMVFKTGLGVDFLGASTKGKSVTDE
jgi:hypothetical protein